MQNIHVSDTTIYQLRRAAAIRGMDADTYADELLRVSLAALCEQAFIPGKLHRAIEFSGVAPTGRTATEIDAQINEGRGPWPDELPGYTQP